MIGSPSNLELLLHCFYCSEPHPRFQAPAIREGISHLVAHGMIEPNGAVDLFRATPKGEAFIRHLMTIPFPEQHWIVPEGED